MTLLDWPSQCQLCGGWPVYSTSRCCAACLARWAKPVARCATCARPTPDSASICGHCVQHPSAFRRVTAAVDYAFPWSRWALRLKSETHLQMAQVMARFMVAAWRRGHEDKSNIHWLWTGVPLHANKLRQRGFNQAWLLAKHCHQQLVEDEGTAIQDLLTRQHWQHDQHTLPFHGRAAAVKNAFVLTSSWASQLREPDIGVVIVDDVMTSGATLTACAQAILKHATVPIETLVFARTRPKSG